MVTVLAVCAARWVAVFPLSRAINWFIRYRAKRRGREATDELPWNYQAMLYWAGLRGAVGVALAALLIGEDTYALKATVLVVVVLTVIIFGGTTARMLEILGIRTGVVEEVDSDDEFDIEAIGGTNYYKRPGGTGIGYVPRPGRGGVVPLDRLNGVGNGKKDDDRMDRSGWASGHRSPNSQSTTRPTSLSRNASKSGDQLEVGDLLGNGNHDDSEFGSDVDTSDLPPPAPRRKPSPNTLAEGGSSSDPVALSGTRNRSGTASEPITATAAIRQLFSSDDPSALFRQLDEDYIKPKLLLDGGPGGRGPG